MTGPASPGTEGPRYGPPSLPAGWIAQWDGASQKYYFVQLSTGVSQWDIPTEAAPTGTTPGQQIEHPYGAPPRPELITHPDGTQTVKHADGTMEPILPDGSRGVDGPGGDRGLGSMAMNALLGGGNKSSSGGGGGGALESLANQFLGGSSGGGNKQSGAGKLVGQLASNLMSPSNKPEAPQNYHGGQQSTSSSHQGGLAGAVFGGVAHMFGGKESSGNQNYGYSNAGTGGSYSGEAPTYNPLGSSSHGSSKLHSSSSHTPQNQSSYGSQDSQSYSAPPSQGYSSHSQSQPSYEQSSYGQHGGGGGSGSYSQHQQSPSYGAPSSGGHHQQQHQTHQQQYPPSSGGGGGYNSSYSGGQGGGGSFGQQSYHPGGRY